MKCFRTVIVPTISVSDLGSRLRHQSLLCSIATTPLWHEAAHGEIREPGGQSQEQLCGTSETEGIFKAVWYEALTPGIFLKGQENTGKQGFSAKMNMWLFVFL